MTRLAYAISKTPLNRPLAWAASRLGRYAEAAANYNNGDPASNGEAMLVRRGAPQWRQVLDVGANVGDWAAMVLGVNPRCRLHCFEPAASSHASLLERFAGAENVRVIRQGVGAVAGRLEFLDRGERSGSSGFVPRGEVVPTGVAVDVQVTTVADYCQNEGLDEVNFVKIDTEGFEMEVLRGMGRMLEQRKVDALQFEYGGTWLDARETLGAAAHLVERCGYALFRLLPDGLARVRYRPTDDTFKYANFVALADVALADRLGLMIDP